MWCGGVGRSLVGTKYPEDHGFEFKANKYIQSYVTRFLYIVIRTQDASQISDKFGGIFVL